MNKDFIVPIVINFCVDFLKERDVHTTYHPKKVCIYWMVRPLRG